MSDSKSLLKSLLIEIYRHLPPSSFKKRRKKEPKRMHPKLYEKRLLEKLSPTVLKDICEILQFEIRLISSSLERVLITRDKNRTHRSILCGFLDILATSKFGESSREMRFGVSSPPGPQQKGRGDATAPSAGRSIIPDETSSSSDFNQWLHAMKMVARLPGGMPPEFRRKLWLALADKYLKSKNVDWEKEEVKCFSEQWREDDEELGIQIVKDLHRTGSSLCSGPAGTINQAKLKRILLGYARFNPEVGYCQGFNMLGALILQVMDKEEIESIKVMIYLVEGILPSGYFSGSLGGLQADMAVFRELMTSKLPRLAKHLQKLQGPVENAFEPPLTNVFTMQWFLTMFCTCLPMTCVLRVWDLVLIEGSDVLLRTALVLWSLLEERILNARTADDFYCQMGSFSSELLNGHLVDSNGLIEKVVDLGPIPDLQKLRDKHLYNITPFRDKKGLQLYYSDEDGDSDEDSRMAVATAWGLRLRRGSGSKNEGKDRIALDISLLKKQYDRLRERQRQAHIILTSAVARQGSNPSQSSIQMNQLLIGRNAIVTNNGRRLGPPQGAIPPARKPSLPTPKPPKLAQTKKQLSGETLHWRDTDLSKRRRGSLKWKDIRSDGSQSNLDDRPPPLIESAPSSRSSSSEAKSRRTTLKATRQRSDSSSYSEESDGNSSTSTSLCDDDEIADQNVSSLEGSPMRKVKPSKKHSEVSKQKSLEDVLNSNDGQPTIDNQIPFIQLTTIESPVLNANKTDTDHLEYAKEDSETESNRLDYAGFVDDFSWPDMNEPTSSVSLEDTTIDATSVEGDFLSMSNVITSTSQLSPIPDITTYINNSNISPLRTPISAFNYASLVVNMDNSKKFDVNEEGVTNEYFERVNIVERPTKLDLLYSLNEEESIRNAYVSHEQSLESSKGAESPKFEEQINSNTIVTQASDEEMDRKMKVLLEYSNQSSLSFIAEAKQEISSGMFKEMEFDVDSLKYQPATLVPLKKPYSSSLKSKTDNEDFSEEMTSESLDSKNSQYPSEIEPKLHSEIDTETRKSMEFKDHNVPKSLAEELAETEFKTNGRKDLQIETNVQPEKIEVGEEHSYEDKEETKVSSNIPSTEDLETRFRALELNFSGRKESLKNNDNKDSSTHKEVFQTKPKSSIEDIDSASLSDNLKPVSITPNEIRPTESPCENSQQLEETYSSKRESSDIEQVEGTSKHQIERCESLEKNTEQLKEFTGQLVEDQTEGQTSSKNLESSVKVLQQTEEMESINYQEKKLSQQFDPVEEGASLLTEPQFEAESNKNIKKDSVDESKQDEPSKKEEEQVKELLHTDRDSIDKSQIEEISNEQKQSLVTDTVENSQLPNHDFSIEDLNKNYQSSQNTDAVSKYKYSTVLANEPSLNDSKEEPKSLIPEESKDKSLSSHTKENFNDELKFSDLHYQQEPEKTDQMQMTEDRKDSFKSEIDQNWVCVSIPSETTSIKDNKSSEVLIEEAKVEQAQQQFTMEDYVVEKSEPFCDKKEDSILNDVHIKDRENLKEERTDSLHTKDEQISSLSNVIESSIEDSKPSDINSEVNNHTELVKETTPIKNQAEEVNIVSQKEDSKLEKAEKIQNTSPLKTVSPTSVAEHMDPSSDSQLLFEDTSIKNLSDDSKQSLLPEKAKKRLHSSTTKEGVLYYEHHPSNEFGSEIEGLNEPTEHQDDTQTQLKESESSSPQETKSDSEKAVVQATTDNSGSKDLQRLEEEENNLETISTTATEKPSSTYSFSYTQDHSKDHVSFLSEFQSSVSPKRSTSNQDSSGIRQSTFDLKHSLPDMIAVTTSVSVKNSASVKSSVSIKSSVSLKSSALYDRERSLNVNAGITVFEDPQMKNSEAISSNQLEKSNRRFNQMSPLEDQNSELTVSIVESKYNEFSPASTSNISVSMRLPNPSQEIFPQKHSNQKAILEREPLKIVDGSPSGTDGKQTRNEIDSCKDQVQEEVSQEIQKRKPSNSQDIEERLKALEKRLSDRNLPVSTDTNKPIEQSSSKEKEPKTEQVLTLDDVQPMKLEDKPPSPKKSSTETEPSPKKETERPVPSTADLEQRFRELERKLSEKNIRLPEKNEEAQQESGTSPKQGNATQNPSIVLPKNEDTSSGNDFDKSLTDEECPQANEDQQTTTRRRIPSTEDLESRFEALELQKSAKSPTNLLSPSKLKEDFLMSTNEPDSSRRSEIPSTEDLENRFKALEQSKKGDKMLTTKSKNLDQEQVAPKNEESANSTEQGTPRPRDHAQVATTNEPQIKSILRSKPKEIPKVTFVDSNDVQISNSRSSEEQPETTEESCTKSEESFKSCEFEKFDRERVLRKVPSARDLEARFEALEKRKSFTGFSTKTQEYLLAEQSRNFLSSDSLNTVESLKRRETNDKKVASTEDLVLRLDALEQRMAITENSIKNQISSDALQSSQAKMEHSPKPEFQCRFEAFDNTKSFRENHFKENIGTNKSAENQSNSLMLAKTTDQETKLNLIKRSLFEDKEPEPKWLPSTEDLEIRFEALEKQKTKSLNNKKKLDSEKEQMKPKSPSTQNWETRFEAFEHRTPKSSPYSKSIPNWEQPETLSKFPSTRDLENRFEALEQQKSSIERYSKPKEFQKKLPSDKDIKSATLYSKPKEQDLEKPTKALSSRSIDQVLEQISTKTEEIEREHKMTSKVPSTQDLEIRYHDLQINTKRGEHPETEHEQNLEQATDSIELTGNHKRRDLYKLESQSDETLTVSDPTGTEFDTKSESRPTSCPEYRDPFDSNIVTTDRVLKIIEENSKILHRILKKTLADSGGNGNSCESMNSRSGFTDSLLALGNIFPRNDESISPSRMKSQSRVRSTITFRSEDSSITDRLASIKSTIKSIDTLCEDQSSRKDKCQRYIDSLFTSSRPTNATSPTPPIARPLIKVDDFESSSRPPTQERLAMRELRKETSPRRRRDEDREEYESRVRRDMMPNNVDAPSELSCSLENIAKVDSEVDRINQAKQVETQLERPLSPYYAPGYDLNNRSTTPTVYIPTKLEIRHTTVTSTFYDRYLTEKHIERTFPRSKKQSPVSPTITKSHLDISNHNSPIDDRNSKSAENSPSRRKDAISPNQTVSAAAYRRSFISSLEVAQKDLHIRSCDNILLQLRSSTQQNNDVAPSAIMMYNPLPAKIRNTPEQLGISLGLYKDYSADASPKS